MKTKKQQVSFCKISVANYHIQYMLYMWISQCFLRTGAFVLGHQSNNKNVTNKYLNKSNQLKIKTFFISSFLNSPLNSSVFFFL